MNYIIDLMLKHLEDRLKGRDVQYFFFGIPETEVSKEVFNKGAIFIQPVDSTIVAVTTGITDEETHTIEIVLAKNMQTKVYQNAQQETGVKFLNRIMDGRDAGNQLQTNTIRYIIRNNIRAYGIRQPQIGIVYNDERFKAEGVVTATLTITQEEHYSQQI